MTTSAIYHYSRSSSAATAAATEPAAETLPEADTVTLSARARLLATKRGMDAQEQSTLEQLITRAAAEGASQDPVGYLDHLTPAERALLQKAHCLAEPIDTAKLSSEGAANLLCTPGEGVDSDNDGFVSYGAARTFQFPPDNAPTGVKEAWDAATTGMSDDERWLASGMFLPLLLRADDAGRVSEVRPGDPDYVAPFSGAGFSWQGLVRRHLEGLEVTRQYGKISDAQYAQEKLLLQRFAEGLSQQGVA